MKNITLTLVSQKEELDEHNNQATPPGFHLIFLPFADDFRKLKYEETPKGSLILAKNFVNKDINDLLKVVAPLTSIF